jgi:serine protease Do
MVTAGVLVVAIGLIATAGHESRPMSKAPAPCPVTESVVVPAEQLGKAFAAVAAHIKPAVVSVYSEKMVKVEPPESPFGDEFFGPFFGRQVPQPKSRGQPRERRVPQLGMGSGMILDKEGRILTNYHVVGEVEQIKVQLADKRTFEAKLVGADPRTDVAVIRIAGKVPEGLPSVELGDSDALEDGYLVMAVGAPFGLTQTVTTGIISARGRADVGIAAYEDFLQTDASINPGNSGGPLVNMRGEVIGMNSAIATGGGPQSAGVGFAIPSNMIKTMLPTLIQGGQIVRGMLGVVIQDVTDELAQQFHLAAGQGALISQVNKDSPAQKAGLKAGDVIVRFEGKKVRDTRQLRNLVAASAPGSRVKIDIVRNGKEETIIATIGKLPAEPLATAEPPPGQAAADKLAALGLSVQTLTKALAEQLDLQGEKGVLIVDVEEGTPAAAANLQPGDLIVEVDRKPVGTVSELRNAFGKDKDRLLFLIKRQGGSLYVVVRLR